MDAHIMDCCICCDEITAATGQATLACSHTFHLGCVGQWLMKNSSCPMCRSETCAKEKIFVPEVEEEQIDFNYTTDSIVDEVPEFDADAHALWVMRETFMRLEDGLSIASVGSTPTLVAEKLWTWEAEFAGVSTVEQAWRRSMHQMATTCLTHSDERGYESC